MKKSKLLVVLLMVLATTLSCSKENEVKVSALIGTWSEKDVASDPELCTFVFNSDNTGVFYSYVGGKKINTVNFTYTFNEKIMELSIVWINAPAWDNPTDMIEIRNGNILIYRNDTYYKK